MSKQQIEKLKAELRKFEDELQRLDAGGNIVADHIKNAVIDLGRTRERIKRDIDGCKIAIELLERKMKD